MTITWIIIISLIVFAVLLCFLLAIANFAHAKFMQKYEELNKMYPKNKMTVKEFIIDVNKYYFHNKVHVQVFPVGDHNNVSDAYGGGILYLSSVSLNNSSIASFATVAHELGHAKQDFEGKKLKKLHFLRRFGKIISFLCLPSLIAGIILLFINKICFIVGVSLLAFAGLILLLSIITRLATISIEKDASKNAILFLSGIFDKQELKVAKKFLNDARLTYWAEFLRFILQWTMLSGKTKMFK